MRGPGRRETASVGEGARKVVLAALAGNLAIAVTKFAAFGFTRSTAMLTEGIHSLVDTGNQLLLLVAQRRAQRPANESHPFGYGMETYFWSFIVALMIFLAGGAVAVWEGVEKVLHPEPVQRAWINFVVLGASMLFEGLSFRTAYREYRAIVGGGGERLFGYLHNSKDPNVFATLLEDGAALAGLSLALAGVSASALLGWLWADGAASIAIGLLLIAVAAFLSNETRSLIAGEAAAPPIVARARAALAQPELGELLELKTLHLGPQAILVAVRWRFPPQLDRPAVELGAARLEVSVRAADPRIRHVLFETAGSVDTAPSSPSACPVGS